MAGVLSRVLVGWLVLGALRLAVRLAWRYGPRLCVYGAGLLLWPSVAVGWALRRWGLPAAEARWPAGARWYAAGLAAFGLGLLSAGIAYGAAGAGNPGTLATLYGLWLIAPLTVPAGLVAPRVAAQGLALAVPLWLAGGVILGGLWPVYGGVVRRGVRPGGMGGSPLSGDKRTPSNAGQHGGKDRAPVVVKMRAQSAQRIATSTHAATEWLVSGWLARGVITLLSADSKAGKTELLFGLIRACFDGLAFCGLATKPIRVLILTEQTPASLYPYVRRWGFWTEPPAGGPLHLRAGRWLLAQWREHVPPAGHPGYVVNVVPWAALYQGKAPGDRPSWADVAPAGIALAVKGGYDVLCVDTLGRWITGEGGSENSNGQMLQAMGALHEAADRGLAVLVNHHNSRAGNIRGATAIEAEVDVILKLSKEIDARRQETAETTTRRLVRGSGRFQEETPSALVVRLVKGEAGKPAHYEADTGAAPRARVAAGSALQLPPGPQGAPETGSTAAPQEPPPAGPLALLGKLAPKRPRRAVQAPGAELWTHPQAHAVMDALTRAPEGATVKTLCDTVGDPLAGLARKRPAVYEWLGRLQEAGVVRVVGQVTPQGGGKPAEVFAVAPLPWTPVKGKGLHLVAPDSEADDAPGEAPAQGAEPARRPAEGGGAGGRGEAAA